MTIEKGCHMAGDQSFDDFRQKSQVWHWPVVLDICWVGADTGLLQTRKHYGMSLTCWKTALDSDELHRSARNGSNSGRSSFRKVVGKGSRLSRCSKFLCDYSVYVIDSAVPVIKWVACRLSTEQRRLSGATCSSWLTDRSHLLVEKNRNVWAGGLFPGNLLDWFLPRIKLTVRHIFFGWLACSDTDHYARSVRQYTWCLVRSCRSARS